MLTVAALGVPGLDTERVSTEVAVRTAVGFGAAALIGAVGAWFGVSRRRAFALIGLAVPLMAFPVVSAGLMESVAADRSARGLAMEIERRLTPETELLWIETYASGVSFYLERPIAVATSDGGELRSNYILRNAEIFFDDEGPLRPLSTAKRAVSKCTGPEIFLLSTRNRDLADAVVESGVSPLAGNRRWLAFGPDCVREPEIIETKNREEVGE